LAETLLSERNEIASWRKRSFLKGIKSPVGGNAPFGKEQNRQLAETLLSERNKIASWRKINNLLKKYKLWQHF
jgi:hypothetical protein